jgi:putative ABC transport system ATP-binding protein
MKKKLATENLIKEYQIDDTIIKAVDDVSIELNGGEFVALVGPSGSGKTTMLAMIAGLLSPNSGEIYLGDEKIGKMSESELTKFRRRKIGFTFQSNNLVPFLNVLENVELMLRLNGTYNEEGKQRAINLLERLGLGERLHNLPSQLSGGQKQRVAIARSLIHDPDLVLADEPTASLDTTLAYQVVETFAELIHEQNRIGIMVTHDLRMVRHVDKVIQMLDGKLDSVITDKREIEAMAGVAPQTPQPVLNGNGRIKQPIPFPVSAGALTPAYP